MPLKEFQITNFKAFSNPDPIPIRPITLIFGPNSSGKSSIIQSLLLLKQTLEDENPNAVLSPKGNEVDLGSFYEFVHRHETERSVSFKMSMGLNKKDKNLKPWLRPSLKDISSLALKPTFTYDKESKQISCSSLELFIGDDLEPVVTFKPTAYNRKVFHVDSINDKHSFWRVLWDKHFSDFTDLVRTQAKQIKEKLEEVWGDLSEEIEEDSENKSEEETTIVLDVGKLFSSVEATDVRPSVSKKQKQLTKILERLNDYTFESFIQDFHKSKNEIPLAIKNFLPIKQVYDLTDNLPSPFPSLVIWSDIKETLEALTQRGNFYVGEKDLPFNWLEELGKQDDDGWITELHDLGYIVTSFLPSDIALYVGKVLGEELSKLIYIGPLRQQPERYYINRGNKVERVGKSGTLAADLLLQDKDVLERTNEFFNKLKYELKVSPLKSDDGEVQDVYAIRLVSMEMNTHANITDVGFGISQVLPVVVQSAVSQNATLCIEQPELHLHPGAQRKLGDLFIESALGERKNTFIIETHSEHIILRILRRIRETTNGNIGHRPEIRPEDVSVIYAKPTSKGTKLYPLEITKDGDFVDDWPGGFFTERVEELF